jgi:sulfur-carrier protein adenylyltransferase/sulfurtransferase
MPKSYADMVAEAKQQIKEVTPADVRRLRDAGDQAVLVDVREDREWNLGHIPGAVHMSRGTLEQKIEQSVPRDRTVVLYCASGNRSVLAADMLRQMGYADVSSMKGGFRGWVDAGGDVEG